MSNASRTCPKCGTPILAEAPQGLCPKCLLALASVPTETGAPHTEKTPPSLATVAAAFPHLEILAFIGQGGMGFVFKARQPKLDRFVALKILPQSLAADPAFAERFTREGRVLARLSHPNIVTVHDFGQNDGLFYLLMEFVDGVNLRQAMKAGRFTPSQALAVVPKICEALQYAHTEGILHRDIKPENILLDARGRVKIADFGIAKLLGEAPAEPVLTGSGVTMGTPHYMAPEQIENPSDVDHRADIYSLGVVFYELLTGELPLGRFAPPSEKSSVDSRVDEIVLRALRKERELRQQSATEIKTQLENVAANALPAETVALGARRTPRGSTSARPKLFPAFSENKLLFALVLLAALAGIGVSIRYLRSLSPLPAMAFNGFSRVEIPSSPDLEFSSQPFSVSLWFRTTTDQQNLTFVAKRRSALGDGWVLCAQEDNRFIFYAASCASIKSSSLSYRDGKWHHLAAVRQDSRVDIYFDGLLAGSGAESCNFQDDHPIFIAMDGAGGDHFQGELADVGIYNRALGGIEISNEWNRGQRLRSWTPHRGAIAAYRFDEPGGIAARDLSGAGHDGLFVNHPARSGKTPSHFAKPSGGASDASARDLPGKTVILTRPTNEIGNPTNNVRGVSVWTDSIVLPDEEFRTKAKLPDGQMMSYKATLFTHWSEEGVKTSCVFTWTFPAGFDEADTRAALEQIRQGKTERPLTFVSGKAVEMFSITNRNGGSLTGYVEFHRMRPGPATASKAIVRIERYAAYIPSVDYTAKVPVGYALRATATRGTVSTHNSSANQYHSSWHLLSRFRPPSRHTTNVLDALKKERAQGDARDAALAAQLEQLIEAGAIEVLPGEPRLLFSVTNSPNDVFQGFLELTGPPVETP